MPVGARDRERAQLAGADERHGRGDGERSDRRFARDHGGRGRPRALEVHGGDVDLAERAEQVLGREVRRRATAWRRVGELGRAGEREQLVQVLRRDARVHDEQIRLRCGLNDRGEVLLRVVPCGGGEAGVHRERAGGAEQRVAVGRRSCDRHRADVAAGARAVLDDDRLSQRLLQPRLKQARHDVDRPARSEGHDDADRLAWVRIRSAENAASGAAASSAAAASCLVQRCIRCLPGDDQPGDTRHLNPRVSADPLIGSYGPA